MIVLSEHVDYWNHIGWKDPYSSHFFSERQSAYGDRFHLESVYTPQMIVDGTAEFTGSDTARANQVFAQTVKSSKVAIRLSSLSLQPDRARFRSGSKPIGFPRQTEPKFMSPWLLTTPNRTLPAAKTTGER